MCTADTGLHQYVACFVIQGLLLEYAISVHSKLFYTIFDLFSTHDPISAHRGTFRNMSLVVRKPVFGVSDQV